MVKPLKLDGFSVRIARREILKPCSFELEAGKIYGLLGLNGSGKTSLLKAICHLLPESTGNCKIFDLEYDDPRSREKIIFHPEKVSIPLHLTGKDYAQIMASIYRFELSQTQVSYWLDRLCLEEKILSKSVKTYSKGMAQKLGLITVFMSSAKLWILDEVMCGLDYKTRASVFDIFKEFRDQGNTILFSTHLKEDVKAICDACYAVKEQSIKNVSTQ